MEADDRRAADGIADVDGNENELHVHQDAVGRNAVLTDVFEQLEVVEHTDDGRGNIAHQLGRAVAAGVQQRAQLQPRSDKAQTARIRAEEIDQREQAAHALAQARRNGRACNSPAEARDKQRVERHIRHARRDRRGKTQLRLFRRDQEALEHVLQHERGCERIDDAAIAHAVLQHLRRCAEKQRDRPYEHHAGHREQHAEQRRKENHHGKIAVGFLLPALAERFGDKCSAARADHEADAAQHHDKRHDQIDRRKGRLSGKVRDEQPVHHAVDRRKDHHDNGREDKLEQFSIGKVIGQSDLLFHWLVLRRRVGRRSSL